MEEADSLGSNMLGIMMESLLYIVGSGEEYPTSRRAGGVAEHSLTWAVWYIIYYNGIMYIH